MTSFASQHCRLQLYADMCLKSPSGAPTMRSLACDLPWLRDLVEVSLEMESYSCIGLSNLIYC